MSQKKSIRESKPYILVEEPASGDDDDFYGKWLRKASKADALWMKALNDAAFRDQIIRLIILGISDFRMSSLLMVSRVRNNRSSFLIGLRDDLIEEFVMMVEMGFFVLAGQRYQMAIPKRLNMDAVKRAALKFAQTEDTESGLHPERLVLTMPLAEARRLRWSTSRSMRPPCQLRPSGIAARQAGQGGHRIITSEHTVSDLIVRNPDSPKLGYTPPKIFKERARVIKLVAEASIALNEHMKVTDVPDFIHSFDDADEAISAVEEAINDREELEYNLACATDKLFFYNEKLSEDGYDCLSIIQLTHDVWKERSEDANEPAVIGKPA